LSADPETTDRTTNGWTFGDPLPTFGQVEESLIAEALVRAGNNQGIAAGLLGISRQALKKRLRRRAAAPPRVS
jgi:two-component system, NtrC family, nitrogen regulation response regulator GlnG